MSSYLELTIKQFFFFAYTYKKIKAFVFFKKWLLLTYLLALLCLSLRKKIKCERQLNNYFYEIHSVAFQVV